MKTKTKTKTILMGLFVGASAWTAYSAPTDEQLVKVENPTGVLTDKLITQGDYAGDIGVMLSGKLTGNLFAGNFSTSSADKNIWLKTDNLTGESNSRIYIGDKLSSGSILVNDIFATIAGGGSILEMERLYGAHQVTGTGTALAGNIDIDISSNVNIGYNSSNYAAGVYAAGQAYDGGSLDVKNISLNVADGSFKKLVGGMQLGKNAQGTISSTKVEMSGGISYYGITGGSTLIDAGAISTIGAEGNKSVVSSVEISGDAAFGTDFGSVASNAIGGNFIEKGTSSIINGSTEVNVKGGNLVGTNIVGGGRAEAGTDTITADTFVNIEGGNIAYNDYGQGGDVIGGSMAYGGTAIIKGNTNVVLSGGNIDGDIYGGGFVIGNNGKSTVEGNANVTVSGDVKIGGTIYGGGYGGATVEGTKTLNFDSFSNSNSIAVKDFDVINVKNASEASFGGYENAKVFVNGNSTANIDNAKYENQSISTSDYGQRLALVQITNSDVEIKNSSFTNNTAESTNANNGVYGVAISASGTQDKVSNVTIKSTTFDANKAVTVAQTQGTVWAGAFSKVTVEDSIFTNNTATGGLNSTGGAISAWGGDVNVKDSIFTGNNVNSGDLASGGAIYAQAANWGGLDSAKLQIEGGSFTNNTANSDTLARGGAIQVSSGGGYAMSASIKDTNFTNNKAIAAGAGTEAVGGAVSLRRSGITFEVSEGKDIVNSGNQAIVNGTSSNAGGGFLYLFSDADSNKASATFDIANNATMTIGQAGVSDADSIASNDNQATITKTGLGTLTVNSSMEHYKGNLNVSGGVMNVNNNLGTNEVNVRNAILNVTDGSFQASAITVASNGSLNVDAGSLKTVDAYINEGGVFNVSKDASADIKYLAFGGKSVIEGTVDVTGLGNSQGNSQNLGGLAKDNTAMTIQNTGILNITQSNLNIGHRQTKDATLNVNSKGQLIVAGDINVGSSNFSSASGNGTLSISGGFVRANKINLGKATSGVLNLTVWDRDMSEGVALTPQINADVDMGDYGVLNLTARIGLTTGDYGVAKSIIQNGGKINAYGGSYANNVFSVIAEVKTSQEIKDNPLIISAAEILTINSNSTIVSGAKTASIASSASSSSSNITIKNADVADHNADGYTSGMDLRVNEQILTAWTFDIVGVDSDNSVVLSFMIGDGYDLSQLGVWHKEANVWSEVSGNLEGLAYVDGVLSFVATGFSDYALTFVPEPTTYAAIFGSLVLVLAIYRRKRK